VDVEAEPVAVRRLGTLAAIGLTVAAALLTSACAAGQKAQTADENETQDGNIARVGSITVAGIAIQSPPQASYPADSAVPLRMVLVNSGRSDDTLTSITSTQITGWGAYRTRAAASAAAQSGGTASGAGGATTSVPVGSNARVSFGTPDAKGAVLLNGIKTDLHPGMSISLTLTFDRAGSTTVQVPVQLSSAPQTSVIPAPSGAGDEEGGEG
jgi:copper(I)-binding protein